MWQARGLLSWSTTAAAIFVVVCVCLWGSAGAYAAGDANEESCGLFGGVESSPGFRSFLPDCRGYELVTPAYAGGEVATGAPKSWGPAVSPDGDRLLGISFSALAGTEGEEQNGFNSGAWYLFSRSEAGWTAEALDPPVSQYPRSTLLSGSADLASSLWELDPSKVQGEEIAETTGRGDEYVFAVREPVGSGKGDFDVLGPKAAPGRIPAFEGSSGFVAASEDLSDVLFEVYSGYKQLWPGDRTREGSSSLYEYRRGHGSEPVLVGVLNDGPLSGTPVNVGAELVSECGIGLGASGMDMYNAVSANGETVYFTDHACEAPQVDELYARIGGAETVRISEPTDTDCEACKTGVPQAALFQGASEDGSRVFFTSEQELLPGASGNSLFEYDFHASQGQRVSLVAPDVPAVARVAEGGTRVYFESTRVLTSTPNGDEEAAEEGAYNLYAYDTETGTPAFVARLLTAAEAAGLGSSEIEAKTGVTSADAGRPFDATRDGEFLLFPSARDLTGSEDTSTVMQLFEYDANTGTLVRVSIGAKSAAGYVCQETGHLEAGYDCNGNISDSEDAPRMVKTYQFTAEVPATAGSSQLSLAENGMVVFESKARLAPQAVAGGENVYEYRSGDVYVISPASEPITIAADGGELTRLMETDLSGNDVYFYTAESLVPQDPDSQSSWYDARVDGGFPGLPGGTGCSGDTCQGGLTTAPRAPSQSGTAVVSPEENLPTALTHTTAPKPETTATKLAKALKACHRYKRKVKRGVCERAARKRYHVHTVARKGSK